MTAPLWVKICGIKTIADARLVIAAGADAIGLNFAPTSKRYITPRDAREIVLALRDETPEGFEWVGVFVNAGEQELLRIYEEALLDRLQLHGEETPDELASLEVPAFKAMRVAEAEDVECARRYGADRILVDSKVAGAHGGTGHAFDWTLVQGLRRERSIVLAGGLRADNVGEAVAEVQPFGVDTASGVESAPAVKDPEKVRRFVSEARRGHALASQRSRSEG